MLPRRSQVLNDVRRFLSKAHRSRASTLGEFAGLGGLDTLASGGRSSVPTGRTDARRRWNRVLVRRDPGIALMASARRCRLLGGPCAVILGFLLAACDPGGPPLPAHGDVW